MIQLAAATTTPTARFHTWGHSAIVWAVTLFLTQAFVGAGSRKLDDASGWTTAFLAWGYPDWFRYLVGVTEVVGGLLILWPRIAAYGAALILAVMIGAVVTHIRMGEIMDAVDSALPSLCFSACLILVRWPAQATREPE